MFTHSFTHSLTYSFICSFDKYVLTLFSGLNIFGEINISEMRSGSCSLVPLNFSRVEIQVNSLLYSLVRMALKFASNANEFRGGARAS